MSSGVDGAISKDIVDRLEASMATDAFFLSTSDGVRTGEGSRTAANRWKSLRFDAARLEAFVRSELESRVAIEATLGAGREHGAAVVMVGQGGRVARIRRAELTFTHARAPPPRAMPARSHRG